MLTIEYSLKDAIAGAREEGMERGIEKGKEEGQKYVLGLLEQGLTYEEIKKKIEKKSKNKRG
ncbi:MAG: hypothetical protein FWF73_03715 [Spirochaetes bacterium]|nr:hypothetical protein [Spirochaetota bacterium]